MRTFRQVEIKLEVNQEVFHLTALSVVPRLTTRFGFFCFFYHLLSNKSFSLVSVGGCVPFAQDAEPVTRCRQAFPCLFSFPPFFFLFSLPFFSPLFLFPCQLWILHLNQQPADPQPRKQCSILQNLTLRWDLARLLTRRWSAGWLLRTCIWLENAWLCCRLPLQETG